MTIIVEAIVTAGLAGIVVALLIARIRSQKQLAEASKELVESYRSFDQLLDRLSQAVASAKRDTLPPTHPMTEHWILPNAGNLGFQVRTNSRCVHHAMNKVRSVEKWSLGNLSSYGSTIKPVATPLIRAEHGLMSLDYWRARDHDSSVDVWEENDDFVRETAKAYR